MSANLVDVDLAMEDKGELTAVEPVGAPSASVAAPPAKKRKEMATRSQAWEQFQKYKNEAGEWKGTCIYCNAEVACNTKNGTSGMLKHMKRCTALPHSSDPKQPEMGSYLNPDGSKSVGTWRFDQEESKRALAKMIIEDELPFRFIEGAGFRKFMATVQIRFQVHSRSTISRFCYKMYAEEKLKLKGFLMSNCERVCITTDTWTSIQRINYMVLTAHFIDNDWNLQKKVLNFIPITSHKGEAIGKALEKCLVDWGISKVFTVTVDNASSNDIAVSWIKRRVTSICNGDFIHVRCIAHIVNLMVLHGLSMVGSSIIKIREAVRYIRQSPSRLSKFKDCVEREHIQSKALLCLDVCTRWNSTYLMLESALKFEKAFEAYEDVDPFYKIELDMREERRKNKGKKKSNETGVEAEIEANMMGVWESHDGEFVADGVEHMTANADFGGGGVPKEEDWVNAKRLCCTLKYFYNLTCFVSGSKYVTSNAYFDQVSNVASMLRTWEMGSDIELRTLARKMREKYEKYWGNVTKFNSLLYISAVLDPRKKMDYVAFALLDVHGEIVGKELAEKVKRDTERMYVCYWELYKKGKEYSLNAVLEKGGCSGSENACEGSTDIDAELISARKERYRLFKEANGGASIQIKSELESYLQESVIEGDTSFSILDWWRKHAPRFPVLSKMVRDVLAVPVSTVASESAFSTGGRVLDPFRSSLKPMVVQALICAQDWFRTSKDSMKVEEDLADLEQMENELSQMAVETTVTET